MAHLASGPVGAARRPDARADRARAVRRVVQTAVAIGLADGVAGISFGAVARASGLTLTQAVVLSLVAFTGSGQFAFVAAVGVGSGGFAAVGSALLASLRNAVYSVRLVPVIPRRWRLPGIQWVCDETAAAVMAQPDERLGWLAFRTVGGVLYAVFGLGTLAGAALTRSLADPATWGLDAVGPAVFLALLAPRLREAGGVRIAVVASACAVAVTPFVPAGVSALVAAMACVPLALGSWGSRTAPARAAE